MPEILPILITPTQILKVNLVWHPGIPPRKKMCFVSPTTILLQQRPPLPQIVGMHLQYNYVPRFYTLDHGTPKTFYDTKFLNQDRTL